MQSTRVQTSHYENGNARRVGERGWLVSYGKWLWWKKYVLYIVANGYISDTNILKN